MWQFTDYFGRPPDLIVVAGLLHAGGVAGPVVGGASTPAIAEDRWVAGTETRRPTLAQSGSSRDHRCSEGNGLKCATSSGRRAAARSIRPCVPSDVEDPAILLDPTPLARLFLSGPWVRTASFTSRAGQFLRAGSEIGWDVHLNAAGEERRLKLRPPSGSTRRASCQVSRDDERLWPRESTTSTLSESGVEVEAYTTLPAPRSS